MLSAFHETLTPFKFLFYAPIIHLFGHIRIHIKPVLIQSVSMNLGRF